MEGQICYQIECGMTNYMFTLPCTDDDETLVFRLQDLRDKRNSG